MTRRERSSSAAERRGYVAWLPPLIVALATIAAFLPALHNGFVSWDDRANFVENPHYRGLGPTQLGWMWTTFRLGHYVPLSWMTLGLDYTIWGMNPAGYHLTNLVLHAVDAVLVYFVAVRIYHLVAPDTSSRNTKSVALAAGFAALFFALHPLRVESVAWVTERRDVLSLFFFLLSLLAYLRWATSDGRRVWYWTALVLFLCALLSKATAMTLPAVLAVLNVYPLKRADLSTGVWNASTRRIIIELAPFALLTAATVVLSIVALHPPGQLAPAAKLAVSAFSLAFYLWKTVAPFNLSPLYEMPQQVSATDGVYVGCYIVAIAITAAAIVVRRRWPAATLAWIVFVVISLPMLGVVQNGPQIAADRYTYHAAPALSILLGGALFLWSGSRWGGIRRAVGVAALSLLGLLCWTQSEIWHDSLTLWTHALSVDSESSFAHSAMAILMFQQNRIEEAIAHGRRAVELAPDFADAHNDLGAGLARQGKSDEALAEYRRAIEIRPAYDDAHNNLGILFASQGNAAGAVEEYQSALSFNPDNADAHVNWGNVLDRAGDQAGAIVHYKAALEIRSDHAEAHLNWGAALAQQGKMAEAADHFRQTLAIDPGNVDAKHYLELAQKQLGSQPR